MEHYPQLAVDLGRLKKNIDSVVSRAAERGIKIAGVIKGMNGLPEALTTYAESGLAQIASSRIDQLKRVKEVFDARPDLERKPLMMIRVPMLSEIADVVEASDMSLNSEEVVVEALNREAENQGRVHGIILMADLGDLREGFWNKEEMIELACRIENEMDALKLVGIGTNIGCYGALVPTAEKIAELCPIASEIESRIGRKLEIVSGGASTSFMRVQDGDMPACVNHLRVGEHILTARDNGLFHGHSDDEMHEGVFILRAEVVEVKEKPSYPVGKIHVDAFGRTPEYEDRGMMRRAIVACGKVDVGEQTEIFPLRSDVRILGGSSDHTILDVTEAPDIKVGDILKFNVNYVSMVRLTTSEDVKVVLKHEGEFD